MEKVQQYFSCAVFVDPAGSNGLHDIRHCPFAESFYQFSMVERMYGNRYDFQRSACIRIVFVVSFSVPMGKVSQKGINKIATTRCLNSKQRVVLLMKNTNSIILIICIIIFYCCGAINFFFVLRCTIL